MTASPFAKIINGQPAPRSLAECVAQLLIATRVAGHTFEGDEGLHNAMLSTRRTFP